MTCPECRGLLALYVEEDLRPEEAAAARDHLSTCAACQDEERALRESQAFWKGAPEPELPERFFADVRRAVRTRIADAREVRETRARRWAIVRAWSALLGAAAAIAAVASLAGRPDATNAAKSPNPRLVEGPAANPTAPIPAPAAPTAIASIEPASSVAAPPHAARVASASRFSRRPLHRAHAARRSDRESAPALARVTRIEMTTENPNVRIIWLSNAAGSAPL